MAYRSILVHASASPGSPNRYRFAARIALAEQAHLAGIAMTGATAFIARYAMVPAMVPLAPDDVSFLTEHAENQLAAFEDAVRDIGVAHPSTLLDNGDAATALPWAARYCDLLVIGQAEIPDTVFPDGQALARIVLVHAPCPVLVVPEQEAAPGSVPTRPLLAWDGSMEASRAVRAALPLLRCATGTVVATFHPAKNLPEGDAAGQALAAYLACHGIATDLLPARATHDVGQALLSLAATHGCDLIVMGAFGHSRVREIVLGGATHTILTRTKLPVLMAH